jgi:predicted small secreted protein
MLLTHFLAIGQIFTRRDHAKFLSTSQNSLRRAESSLKYFPTMKALYFLPLVAISLLLSGCNTVKGLGEDISGSASWTQDKMSGDSSSSTKSSDSQYVQNPPQFQKAN